MTCHASDGFGWNFSLCCALGAARNAAHVCRMRSAMVVVVVVGWVGCFRVVPSGRHRMLHRFIQRGVRSSSRHHCSNAAFRTFRRFSFEWLGVISYADAFAFAIGFCCISIHSELGIPCMLSHRTYIHSKLGLH